MSVSMFSLRNINNVRPTNSQAIVSLFSAFDPNSTSTKNKPVDIVDPYYGSGMSGFERCYKQCVDYSNGFLDQLEAGELEVPVDRRKVKKAGL
jgi:low molecular weight phosphotyrosine protein phosphatase